MVKFHYNCKSKTIAVLKSTTLTLEIIYVTQDYMRDNEISKYLFGLISQFKHIDDLSIVLQTIPSILKALTQERSFSMTSYINTDKDKELLSEIVICNGVVTKYSFTTRANDSKICFYKNFLSENLEEFILSHKR